MNNLIYLIIWIFLQIIASNLQSTTQNSTSPIDNFIVGCGYEKKCISLSLNESRCTTCNISTSQCDVLATWRSDVIKGLAYFELYTAVANMDFVALGVSTSEVMGSSDVFACQLDTTGNVVVKDTWNTVGENSVNLLDPTQEGIEMIDWSYRDGGLYCKFSRDSVGRGYTDLNLFQEQFHILTAVGMGKELDIGQGVGYHKKKCYTPSVYSIAHEITSGCGRTKECLILKDVNSCESCSGTECKFAITWAKDATGSKVIFEIESKYAELDYAAIGLSQNQLMGDSDVFACQLSLNGGIVIKDTFNTVGISSQNVLASTQKGIEMIDSSFSNGVLYCKFSRNVRKSGENGFYLFGEDFNFIFAVGKGKNDGFKKGVGYHTEKCGTFSKFNLNTEFSKPVEITAGCRVTKQCLFVGAVNNTCDPCLYENCELIAAWQYHAPTNSIIFEMEIQRSNIESLSIGISNGEIVNGSEVYTCKVDSIDGVTIHGVYIPDDPSQAQNISLQDRVQLISSRINDQSLYCKFERAADAKNDTFNILTDPYYLSFQTNSQNIKQTNNEHCKTADHFFLKSTNVQQNINYKDYCTNNQCLAYKDITTCQQDMKCVKNDTCQFVIAWSFPEDKEQVTFYLRLNLTGMSWATIGFSNDTLIGQDDIIGCQLTIHGGFVAKDLWISDSNTLNQLDKNQNGIKLISGYYANNILTCVMTRSTIPPYNTHGFNLLARAYHLSSAVGRGLANEDNPTGLPIHTYKCVTKSEIKLDPENHVGPYEPDTIVGFVIVHAITMLFAWLIVYAAGIYIARFCRGYFAGKLWMKLHGGINIFGCILVCLGVIFAIIGGKGWYIFPGATNLIFHQLFGVLITLGILINPVIALFLCKEDITNKSVFKLIHTGIGLCIETFAVINIALGLSVYYLNNASHYGLSVYLAIALPLWVIMQIVYVIKVLTKSGNNNKKESSIVAELEDNLETNLISPNMWDEVKEEGERIRKENLFYKLRYKPKNIIWEGIKVILVVSYWLIVVIAFLIISALIISKK
ncbi:hypothetical protein LOD99_4587 [Oopsacas minuta]|uniref:Ferric-chelate reductase 1 n=1 Tax=Oopsacas minuta TaxID=111878 RepID=A0AAV7JTC6_9METZ|nr:hypothetical protein LOD99_4587 [Oopsacas minuta]